MAKLEDVRGAADGGGCFVMAACRKLFEMPDQEGSQRVLESRDWLMLFLAALGAAIPPPGCRSGAHALANI